MAPLPPLHSISIANTSSSPLALSLISPGYFTVTAEAGKIITLSTPRFSSLAISRIGDVEDKAAPKIVALGRPSRRGRRRIVTALHEEHRIFYQQIGSRRYAITIIDRVDMSSWMSSLSDEQSLASLYIPGTHESLAFFGGPISTCQSLQYTLYDQLRAGIRFVDLRFALKDGKLKAYHGIQNEYAHAEDVFAQLYRFLDERPTETVICSIKQENRMPYFEDTIWRLLLDARPDRWFVENRWPKLGEVRGRAVVLCRFDFHSMHGLHPIHWPHNAPAPFESGMGGRLAVLQDWYSIGSIVRIPEKAQLALSLFRRQHRLPRHPHGRPAYEPPAPLPPRISFTSAASLLTAFPSTVAKGFGFPRFMLGFPGVNQRCFEGLLQIVRESPALGGPEGRDKGEGGLTLVMDFFEEPQGLLELIVAFNTMGG